MPIFDIYSKRQKRASGDVPDVYRYDDLPRPLRVQIVQILDKALGSDTMYGRADVAEAYTFIHDTLAHEYGVFRLANDDDGRSAVQHFFLDSPEVDKALDVVELAFRFVDRLARKEEYRQYAEPKITADSAITELNGRLSEHGIGFQYESGDIIRVDSRILHAEVIKPALRLLNESLYKGANEEYLGAYDHYRHERFEDAIANCLKAFESVLKAICYKRGWPCVDTDTAKRLLDIAFEHELVSKYLQSEFSSLRASLESGVPTVRNKQGGHGKGIEKRVVPSFLAAYLLHLTGASILFLAEAEKSLS